MRNLQLAFVFSLVFIALLFGGCTKFTLVGANVASIPVGSPVAVSILSCEAECSESVALEGYFTAALLARKHHVRTIRLESIIGAPTLARLFPEEPYTIGSGFAEGMEEGGALEGDVATFNDMLGHSEFDDAQSRLSTMVELANAFPKDWDVEYLVLVQQFDAFGFAMYAVDLKKKQVIHSAVVSGNQKGFKEALGEPQNGRQMDADDGDVTRIQYMRLADVLVSKL